MGHSVGIDVGTTNVKVALVDHDGAVVAASQRPLTTLRGVAPTAAGASCVTAVQDATAMWLAVTDAVSEVTAAHAGAAKDVDSVGVCSQYSSIVPVDAAGEPVAEMVTYMDQRGTPHSWAVMERHPEAFELWVEHHGVPPVGGGLSLGHLLHLQADRPEVHDATATYLEPMDFVNLRLTGRPSATQCTMFAAQLCDNRSLGATSYDDDLVRMAGVDPQRLPPLVDADGTAGELTPQAARRLGLPVGARVHAGMNDSHAGAYATGAYSGGHGGLVIGTTAVLLDDIDHCAVDLDREIVSMPSPAGTWLAWAENGIAGKAVEHVLEHVVYAEDVLGDHLTDDHFAALDAAIASVPAGSGGVLFLPWLAGSMAPAATSRMRGGFIGLSLDTRRTDMVRAMVEGTALNLGWLLPAVEAFCGRGMAEVVLGGGAARSSGWAQVLADVLDRPVRTLAGPGTANARAVALVSAGLTEPALLVRTAGEFDPDPGNRATYERHQEQFIAAHAALRPISEALST